MTPQGIYGLLKSEFFIAKELMFVNSKKWRRQNFYE